jgi:para-aminobenzoate synthetase/4-amino-4-deoxychorismate lyase
MEIINELEKGPRGIYCGAIGCVAPGGEALFSVAIRTLLFDAATNSLTMGVGSGITWDSNAAADYAECLNKGAFVNYPGYDFALIESLRLEQGSYTLLDRHVARLTASAKYFEFQYDEDSIRQTLALHAAQTTGLCKVRLLLTADGGIDLSSGLLLENNDMVFAAIGTIAVDSRDPMRYHKTTRRELLEAARARHPDYDEVLLVNEHGQLTEGSYHNLVVKLAGKLVTPPLSTGLLPGVLREELLEQGIISERILYPDDLKRAEEIWLVNSVRGWRRCMVI